MSRQCNGSVSRQIPELRKQVDQYVTAMRHGSVPHVTCMGGPDARRARAPSR